VQRKFFKRHYYSSDHRFEFYDRTRENHETKKNVGKQSFIDGSQDSSNAKNSRLTYQIACRKRVLSKGGNVWPVYYRAKGQTISTGQSVGNI